MSALQWNIPFDSWVGFKLNHLWVSYDLEQVGAGSHNSLCLLLNLLYVSYNMKARLVISWSMEMHSCFKLSQCVCLLMRFNLTQSKFRVVFLFWSELHVTHSSWSH